VKERVQNADGVAKSMWKRGGENSKEPEPTQEEKKGGARELVKRGQGSGVDAARGKVLPGEKSRDGMRTNGGYYLRGKGPTTQSRDQEGGESGRL